MGNYLFTNDSKPEAKAVAETPEAEPEAKAAVTRLSEAKTPRVIHCSEPWYTHIREGRKPVEGRKASPTWADIAEGDELIFTSAADEEQSFTARVTGVTRYEGPGALRRYLEGETLARALPGVETLDAGEAVYLQWSTAEEIDRYGMMGIQVAVTAEAH